MRYPKNIRPGDTIGFAAPAFGCATEPYYSAFKKAIETFHKMGYGTNLGENCLVDQEFVKAENHENVQTYINNVAKALGTEIKCTGFVRMMKGEGLEKREENFAEEIAKQING